MAEEQQESYIASILNNPEKKRKSIIIAALIVILIIVLAVVLVLVIPKRKPSCKLTKYPKTDIDLADIKAIRSAKNNALVRYSGYLYISMGRDSDFQDGYLELEPHQVRYHVSNEGEKHLMLDTDCATLDLSVTKSGSVCHVNYIGVESKTSLSRFKSCWVDISDINYDCKYHWLCSKGRFYQPCWDTKADSRNTTSGAQSIRVSVNFRLLEFEIGGHPEDTAKGHFSTEAVNC